MTESSEQNKKLLARLEELSQKHQLLQQDLIRQRTEINELKEALKQQVKIEDSAPEPAVKPPAKPVVRETGKKRSERRERKLNLEEFIGGNLINKIGILVLIIGVGIGAKYAIDHDWISPVMRIVLGYLVGIGLLGFGFRLKPKYENFSAVLMSGSMAIFYFISYAAHAYYELIPVWMSFALMAGITVLTVYLAIHYDKQVIAHIGLVGAYTIPFLFLETNERPDIFFPFMAIVNGGILVLSIIKKWKSLFYSSFAATWLILLIWFVSRYESDIHTTLSLIILPVFFMTFLLIFHADKHLRREKLNGIDGVIMAVNSLLLFGPGLAVLSGNDTGKELMGTFTLGIAVIHALVFIWFTRIKYQDRNLVFLNLGLSLFFLTLAIPIELDGNWLTIAWLIETLALFSFGRLKKVRFIERISYLLISITTLAMVVTWISTISFFDFRPDQAKPFINFNFLTGCLIISGFGFIVWLHNNPSVNRHMEPVKGIHNAINVILPFLILFIIYFTFRIEIAEVFNQWYDRTRVDLSSMKSIPFSYRKGDHDIHSYRSLCLLIYTIFIFSALSLLNIKWLKNKDLGLINVIINWLLLFVVVIAGIHVLGSLRESFMDQTLSEYYYRGSFHVIARYVYLVFIGLLLRVTYNYARQEFQPVNLRIPMDLILHVILITVISTELIQWLDLSREPDSYKLELSILWGLYAVLLIVLGIWKKKKHLRIMAIVLFSGTLMKVFIYDISHLNTISKTIVLIILGILLLITSYLYIRYRAVLFGSEEKKGD